MASRSEPENPPTFGDLLNGFTLDSGRGLRRRRNAHRDPSDAGRDSRPTAVTPHTDAVDHDDDPAPAVVRPYAWTRGRTTSQYRLELETLLSTTTGYSEHDDAISSEHHAV